MTSDRGHPLHRASMGARQAALEETGLLELADDAVFDSFTRLASAAVRVPVVLLSLVDRQRQFFCSAYGLSGDVAEHRETPLQGSFCQHVVMAERELVIADARQHPLVKDSPAISRMGIIAYAGIPLTTRDGHVLGSFCAIDDQRHDWSGDELRLLRTVAAQVMTEIDARLRLRRMRARLATVRPDTIDFAAMARLTAVDFAAPLDAIGSAAAAVPLLGALNPGQRQALELVHRGVDALRELVGEFDGERESEAAVLPMRARQVVAAADLAMDAFRRIAGLAARRHVSPQFSVAEACADLRVDRERIAQALAVLLGNAVDFNAPGGTVEFSVEPSPVHGQPAIVYRVVDRIPAQFGDDTAALVQRIRATGLGLTFCRRVAEAHGGGVTVQARADRGYSMRLWLPAA